MGANILTIGVTGLNAAQANLITTGQNISNAGTPGYSRQQVVQTSNEPMFTGNGFLGQGTNIETVKRIYSHYLNTQLLGSQTTAASMDSYAAQISQVNNLLSDTSTGLSPAMNGFFSGLSDLAAAPASIPSRQAFLSDAQSLVARFGALNQRINEVRFGVNTQIDTVVTEINAYAQQIADINQRILVAQAAGSSQPANDLLDQRDQLINELNKQIRVTAVSQTDGSYSIFMGTGQLLVTGNQASKLVAQPDEFDAFRTVVAMKPPTGNTFVLPDNQLVGGALGGLVAFRNESLDPSQNALGRLALTLADRFNTQHKLGQDLTGALGGNFFRAPAPQVMASTKNPLPDVTVNVTVSDVSALTTSDYQLISHGGGNYDLLRISDNTLLLSNGPLPASVDGLAIQPAMNAPNGATYLIRPTRSAASDLDVAIKDVRNLAVAAPIRTGTDLNNKGTASISAGTVSAAIATAPPAAAITLRYLTSPSPAVDGFPVGARVDNGAGQIITITSPTTPVPYVLGNTLSFNGLAVNLTGAPGHGDSFTINPPPGGIAGVANTGLASLFGAPPAASVRGAQLGSVAPTYPMTITAGVNDQFDIALDGGASSTRTLAAGIYTSASSLASAVQAAIGGGASVTTDATGKLRVTSTTVGGATAVAMSATGGNTGFNALFGGAVSTGNRAVQTGSLVLGNPTNIVAGVSDRFSINVDGTTKTILFPAGSYTPAALATQLQTTLNAQFPAPGVEVSLQGGSLSVISNQLGGSSAISLGSVASGVATLASSPAVTRTDTLPAATITLQYDQATNTFTGFPVGSVVTVAGDPSSPYSITSTLTPVAYTAGASISFNGMSLTLSGTPVDGDRFTIGPNTSGVTDNRNALLLGGLQTSKILDGNSTTLQGGYASMVNQVGNKTREVQVGGKAQQALVEQAQQARDSVSGVNLDEEAANLLRFQQAYQASARLISVSGKLFDDLLQVMQ